MSHSGSISLGRKDANWENGPYRCLMANCYIDMAHLMLCERPVIPASAIVSHATICLTVNQSQASGVSVPVQARRNLVALAGVACRQQHHP